MPRTIRFACGVAVAGIGLLGPLSTAAAQDGDQTTTTQLAVGAATPTTEMISAPTRVDAGAGGTASESVPGIVARPAGAQEDVAVQIFQTASSLENLAVQTYGAALGLPFIGDNPVIQTFAETTMQQHDEHGAAFKEVTADLGGKRQEGTNSKNTPVAALERAYPLRELRYLLRQGSDGAGLAPGARGSSATFRCSRTARCR